jgi:hypothetical protein
LNLVIGEKPASSRVLFQRRDVEFAHREYRLHDTAGPILEFLKIEMECFAAASPSVSNHRHGMIFCAANCMTDSSRSCLPLD